MSSIVGTYNHDHRIAVLVELQLSADIKDQNEPLESLVSNLAMHVASMSEYSESQTKFDQVLKSSYIKNPGLTVDQYLTNESEKLGFEIVLTRIERVVASYPSSQ